ncbi:MULTISPECIES: hypothetical protein [Microbacterium]|uniref:Uncharacterized protein n=1 Tax=Microbacterium binotii TaxID=462710 RepID=A0ABN3PD53_9MICO|nr:MULTISPECIES: hypothetical protein [Microbacterium]MDQ1205770.1 hypothetical protein [Microbacterium sp. SORGH_AS_0862]MDY0827860.1 hypothetical protein [Microbacterium sp. BG28]UIN31218.1 hypothetical protein LXM64_03130 [Microbacterium binotii]WDG17548.1 hypothetical protein PQV94_13110 [Microbacterium sp. Clip185]
MSLFGSGPSDDQGKPSATRIGIWIAVAGVGLFFLISGIIGIVSGGGN